MHLLYKGQKVMMCPNTIEHLDGRDLIMASLKRFFPPIFFSEIDDSMEKKYIEPGYMPDLLKMTSKVLDSIYDILKIFFKAYKSIIIAFSDHGSSQNLMLSREIYHTKS